MVRIGETRLVDMALHALEEVAAACRSEPVRRRKSIALALAFLADRGKGQRWPYDRFWKSIEEPREQDRWSNVNAALNAIYLAADRKRDVAITSMFEADAVNARKPESRAP